MVDAEDLGLVELLGDEPVQLASRGEVVAERLLDDQAVPPVLGAALADLLDERPDCGRRDGEVVDAVAAGAHVLVQIGERFRDLVPAGVVAEVHVQVAHSLGERLPDVLRKGSRPCSWTADFMSSRNSSSLPSVRATPSTAKLRGRRCRKASE